MYYIYCKCYHRQNKALCVPNFQNTLAILAEDPLLLIAQ